MARKDKPKKADKTKIPKEKRSGRKERKRNRKKREVFTPKVTNMARAIADYLKTLPPRENQGAHCFDTNLNQGYCIPHGGRADVVIYCKDCFWNNRGCLKKGHFKFLLINGELQKR
jgi:hypothetical protein